MKYMKQDEFKNYYKSLFEEDNEFYKSSALTDKEIVDCRKYIAELQKKDAPAKVIIEHLQHFNPKLMEKWRAERVYYTETKKQDSNVVGEAGQELEIKSYRVILSPHACDVCHQKSMNGTKVFKNSDITKGGYGHVPPFHPNCYCVLLPKE